MDVLNMVQLRQILNKLSPELKFSDHVLDYDIGEYDFDTVEQKDIFAYEYTNSKNPNIKLRIKDDFPFRIIVIEKKDDTLYGTTWNGEKQINWEEKDEKLIKRIMG